MEKTLGELIDRMFEVRNKKYAQNDQIKILNEELKSLEDFILEQLDEQGLDKASGEKATASRSLKIYPSVDNKELFLRWVVQNEKFEMIQSKCNAAPVRELLENENIIPEGVSTFDRMELSLRKR